MTHTRLEHFDKAIIDLDEARVLAEVRIRGSENDLGALWQDWASARLLLEEAEALIRNETDVRHQPK
jgi:hypothetical protein